MLVFAVGDCGRALAQQRQETPAVPAQKAAAQAKEVPVGDFLIAEPIRCKNLTVFPVLSTKPKNEDLYITLEEGLKSHKVKVYEVGAKTAQKPGGQNAKPNAAQSPDDSEDEDDVNHLMVTNRAAKPLYLMAGEIIFGGKQDRCVGEECVIPADGKPVKIEVYCVESDRWSDGETFAGKAGNLGKNGRATVQEGKGQEDVWKSVRESNAASGVHPATNAFTANYTDPKILKKIQSYAKEIEKPVAEHRQVVGAIVAVNNKIEVVDVFGSTPLFRKVWPKLLNGYALDAAVAASEKIKKGTEPPTLKSAEKFLREAMESQVQEKAGGAEGMAVTKRESKRIVSYSASDKSKGAPAAMGGMGGFGGSLHGSGYSK
jgi:hypothetical protein